SADPPMLAGCEAAVIGRQVFEYFNIRGETDARVRSFDQIVAEQSFRWKSVAEDGVESVDIVDGLAMKDRFLKEVLLGVRNGAAVRIGAACTRKDTREPGGGGAGQRDADAWLDDRVTALADPPHRIDLDPIQRMR